MQCPKGEEVSSSLAKSFGVDLGDFIGVESSVDLRSDLSLLEKEIISDRQINECRRRDNSSDKRFVDHDHNKEKRKIAEKEYPPPIPWLARTENLPSHMPWVMKKYIMDDGRLIIREEKVKRHEYFQAHRSNGRLTLRLVPLPTLDFSDNVDDVDAADLSTTTTEENQNRNQSEREEIEKEESMPSTTSSDELSCMDSSDGEYFRSVRRNSTVFGMALPASFSPVHT